MKVGDLVQLKSGGPCMTVLDVKATVKCGWFTDGKYYDAHFPDECLEPYALPIYRAAYSEPRIVPMHRTIYPEFLGSLGD
jgi:uncharacterized protein YodC (DUF2158 family)